MSKIADKVYDILVDMFPRLSAPRITKEIYVNYSGQRLYFDFFIKELGVYIEVQGRQHTEFVKHFHGERDAFLAQKTRDNLKIQYVEEKGQCLIRFNYNEKITKTLVRKKINRVLKGECFYE
jgi:very-short-patch-repair endonuclease